jgi:hypothetical protein
MWAGRAQESWLGHSWPNKSLSVFVFYFFRPGLAQPFGFGQNQPDQDTGLIIPPLLHAGVTALGESLATRVATVQEEEVCSRRERSSR